MKYDPNRNAKLIIPLAIAAWLGGMLVSGENVPAVFEVIFVAAFAIAVPVVVFYLIGEAGWRALAKRYRVSVPFSGDWQACATGQMALVSVNDPMFRKVKMRFIGGSLRVATTADALYLTTIVSGLPVLRWFFPSLQIPWAAVTKARAFEAPGWFAPLAGPGTLLQVAYDPNYTGKFIEMEIGDPTVFVQLPAAILGEDLARVLRVVQQRDQFTPSSGAPGKRAATVSGDNMKLIRPFVLAAVLAFCVTGFATASSHQDGALCCSVVSVNVATGVATLRDLKSGVEFTVQVADKAKLMRLKPGQMVDRNATVVPAVPAVPR